MPDWIQRDDAAFDAQLAQMQGWLNIPANATKASISSTDVDQLTTRKAGWDTNYDALLANRQAGLSLTAAKNTARDFAEAMMRAFGEQMQARFKLGQLTEADLIAAGCKVHDSSSTPVAAPTTRPLLQIGTAQRLEHRVTWTDETTPGSRKRPAGVAAMELRIAVTPAGQPAPADPDDFNFYRVNDPASPNVVTYDAAEAAKTAHAIGRWLSTRQEPGPWSAVVSATIQG